MGGEMYREDNYDPQQISRMGRRGLDDIDYEDDFDNYDFENDQSVTFHETLIQDNFI